MVRGIEAGTGAGTDAAGCCDDAMIAEVVVASGRSEARIEGEC